MVEDAGRQLTRLGPAQLAQRSRPRRAVAGRAAATRGSAAAAPARSPSSSRVRPSPLSAIVVRRAGGERALEVRHGLGGAAGRGEGPGQVEERLGVASGRARRPARRSAIASAGRPVRIRTTPSLREGPDVAVVELEDPRVAASRLVDVALDQRDVAQPAQRLEVVGLELEDLARRPPPPAATSRCWTCTAASESSGCAKRGFSRIVRSSTSTACLSGARPAAGCRRARRRPRRRARPASRARAGRGSRPRAGRPPRRPRRACAAPRASPGPRRGAR